MEIIGEQTTSLGGRQLVVIFFRSKSRVSKQPGCSSTVFSRYVMFPRIPAYGGYIVRMYIYIY